MSERDKAYWEARHPKVDKLYQGRPLPDGKPTDIDVRHFIWADDIILKHLIDAHGLKGQTFAETVVRIQQYVVRMLKYVSDSKIGASEYWLFPNETVAMEQGDCEDGAILIASMILNAIDVSEHWRVRVSAGWVQARVTAPQGGHAYVTVCRPSDNEWVVVDWCYLEDSNRRLDRKPLHKQNGVYKDVWFSFNHQFAWSHMTFDLAGRFRPSPDDDK